MDLLEHLQRQLSYDSWANGEVLATIRAGGSGFDSAPSLKLLAHILSAERLWLERLGSQAQRLPVWPQFSLEECGANIAELSNLWNQYFTQLSSAGLAGQIVYKNSKGEPWTSSVHDVLTHVFIHSAYHRGQIASGMRASGISPTYTDYIHAVRQGLIE